MPSKSDKGSVRIIAGQWRGRRLPVIDVPGLRPSGDRGRETLFNWLQAYLPGAVCADLYAGSGALGLEAASRGASAVTLVDSNVQVVSYLKKSVELLNATQVRVHHGDAQKWLEVQSANSFDLIFVDPPFSYQSNESVLRKIEQSGSLKAGGFIYLESSALQAATIAPSGWSCWRERVMGDVRLQVFWS